MNVIIGVNMRNLKRNVRVASLLKMNGLHKEARRLRKIASDYIAYLDNICSIVNQSLAGAGRSRTALSKSGGDTVIIVGFTRASRESMDEKQRNDLARNAILKACIQIGYNCRVTPLGIVSAGTPDSSAQYIDLIPPAERMDNGQTRVFAYELSEALDRPVGREQSGGMSPSTQGGQRHTVQPGENLTIIARRYSISPDELASFNNIQNPDQIRPGQVLKIP